MPVTPVPIAASAMPAGNVPSEFCAPSDFFDTVPSAPILPQLSLDRFLWPSAGNVPSEFRAVIVVKVVIVVRVIKGVRMVGVANVDIVHSG